VSYGNKNPWYELGLDHRVRWWDDFDGIEFFDGEEVVYLDKDVAWMLFEFSRGAQRFPLCTDMGPTPAGSEGVQAEAKRSPKGCLDAEASAGHALQRFGYTAILETRIDVYTDKGWHPGLCTWTATPGLASVDPKEATCCV